MNAGKQVCARRLADEQVDLVEARLGDRARYPAHHAVLSS
jgi:hypothetical protein